MAGVDNLVPFTGADDPRRGKKPKGVPNTKTRLQRLLKITQNMENPITGELEGFTVAEQMDLRQIMRALKGDTVAYNSMVDRLEGKPKQQTDITTGGEPLKTALVKFIGDDEPSTD